MFGTVFFSLNWAAPTPDRRGEKWTPPNHATRYAFGVTTVGKTARNDALTRQARRGSLSLCMHFVGHIETLEVNRDHR
jgi:hypothetical protein